MKIAIVKLSTIDDIIYVMVALQYLKQVKSSLQAVKSKSSIKPFKLDKSNFSIQEIDTIKIITMLKELLHA